MQKVFQFLIQRINFIIFLILEILSFILIFSNGPYQGTSYFNSSSSVTTGIISSSNSIKEYMNLRDENEILAKENRDLKLKLGMKNLLKDPSYKISTDSTIIKKYNFIVAKVINNSTDKFHNYLTINKGWNDSITPGMGVICPTGVVGKVKSCSKYFATITSLLHKDMLISSKIKSSNAIGTTHWEGMDPTKAMLMYIPRHIKVNKGDVVLASEFNSVFPEGEMIGKVSDIKIRGDDNFYKLDIKLATDFSTLNYVYVIRNRLKFQQDSLETMNIGDNESK